MIEIGVYNKLRILRETTVGLFLGDDEGESVLLPNKYCPKEFELDDEIEVFVYLDHEERKVATNIAPKIQLNDFALLKVNAVTEVGAFMDWGLEKELLVPYSEQRMSMEEGRWYMVYLCLDNESERLFASNKIEKFLQNEVINVKEDDEVDIIIYRKTDLGYLCIINEEHKGLLYANEVFRELNIGDKLTAFVKKVREDNKIDLSLQAKGFVQYNDANEKLVMEKLKENEGFLSLHDKSSPDEIYEQLGISKKAFKKTIGTLYKQKAITLQEDGIRVKN